MLIVHVQVHVKEAHVEDFVAATKLNAAASRQEPGVVRFDLIRDDGAPNRFVLVEIYRDDQAPAAHKATAHYATWRDAVEPWMASPRTSAKYRDVDPDVSGY
jgi:(4S)-4-hydroxy-5-phosphonooxypentane-2,3-dione isomerase